MDSKASPINHVALSLHVHVDAMDIDAIQRILKLQKKRVNNCLLALPACSNISSAIANRVPHNTIYARSQPHGLTALISHWLRALLYDISQLYHFTTQAITNVIDFGKFSWTWINLGLHPWVILRATNFPAVYKYRLDRELRCLWDLEHRGNQCRHLKHVAQGCLFRFRRCC